METRDKGVDIKNLVLILRRTTTAVQVMPFIYTALYIIAMLFYVHAGETTQTVIDMLFYVSPVPVAAFLLLSRLLRLCIWHKTACILPLVPQAVSIATRLPEGAAVAFDVIIVAISVALLFAAYKVFFA